MSRIRIALHWQILIGIALGISFAFLLPETVPTLSILGTIFLRALKMIVIPLIVSSLICGVTNISGKALGRIGGRTLIYYIVTSILALITGLFLVNLVKPGVGKNIPIPGTDEFQVKDSSIVDTLTNIVPENIFKSLSEGNMLPIIFFSILFGIFITKLNAQKRKTLTDIFDSVFDVMMKLTLFVIKFAPIGVMGIVAKVVGNQLTEINKLADKFAPEVFTDYVVGILEFTGVVVAGLCIHLFVTLPMLLYFVGKVSPVQHYKSMFNVLLTAFSTASSNATLPLTLETLEEKTGVSNQTASFTLPLGATINMDGTGLYELVVAGFIAQLLGIDLTISQQFVLVLTALLASVGTAGVPMASFVTMAIIFNELGLPLEAMGIILIVDRPLDMFRTATNVFSDTCGAVIIAKSENEKLNY